MRDFSYVSTSKSVAVAIFGFYVHNAGDSISTKNCGEHINVYQSNRNATKPTHSSSPQPNIAKYILENKPQLTDDGNDSGNKRRYIGSGSNVEQVFEEIQASFEL